MAMSKPPPIFNTSQSLLYVCSPIFTRERDGRFERYLIAGFLSGGDVILLVTGGTTVQQDAMFYRVATFNDDTYVGQVRFIVGDIIFIELSGRSRDEVSNLLTSQIGQRCAPVVYTGDVRSLLNSMVLNHRGRCNPVTVTIRGFQRQRVADSLQPYFPTSNTDIVGSLVTSIQGGESDGRLLEAYGPVCSISYVRGSAHAVIAMLGPAIQRLQQITGGNWAFLTPILEVESCDAGHPVPSPVTSPGRVLEAAEGGEANLVVSPREASEEQASDSEHSGSHQGAAAAVDGKRKSDSGYPGS